MKEYVKPWKYYKDEGSFTGGGTGISMGYSSDSTCICDQIRDRFDINTNPRIYCKFCDIYHSKYILHFDDKLNKFYVTSTTDIPLNLNQNYLQKFVERLANENDQDKIYKNYPVIDIQN